jgi:hypothetical protein
VKAMAIFIDSTMTVSGAIPPQATISAAMGKMQPDLACHISNLYDLHPPMDHPRMQAVHFPTSECDFLLKIYWLWYDKADLMANDKLACLGSDPWRSEITHLEPPHWG